MEHNAKNICRTIISSKEQNLNEQMVEFRISILFQYFMNILAKFNTFQGLENQFHNSIFFQYLAVLKFNSAWEPLLQLNLYLFTCLRKPKLQTH